MLPINDLLRHYQATASLVLPAIERVAASGWYILGEEGSGFEQEFADFCGVPHAAGVANGTDAIEIGLRALGVGSGDLVATVANAGYYTCTALAAIGATPLFVDIDPDTHLMDVADLERALADFKPRALVLTHLYGRLCNVEALSHQARRHGISILEDCAQAHGALRGARAGGFGDAATFSFYPTKNLGALGDAGAVITRDAQVDIRVRQLRQYGWVSKYKVERAGSRNSRLDELQAAVLRAKLPMLEVWNERRRAIAQRLTDGIRNTRVTVPAAKGADDAAHLYVVRSAERDDLRDHLRSAGIGAEVHYPTPDFDQTVVLQKSARQLPVTRRLSSEILSLPCFPEMTDAEVDLVIHSVNSW